jgi:hypothetical protein
MGSSKQYIESIAMEHIVIVERSGRPLVTTRFVTGLERLLGRPIAPPRSGGLQLNCCNRYHVDAFQPPEERLGLTEDFDSVDLKRAKNSAALLYHPDRAPNLVAELKAIMNRRMAEMNDAYAKVRKDKKWKR